MNKIEKIWIAYYRGRKKLEQLKKAWEAPDSPFYGQPFDPTQFNLNEPIYFNTPDYENKLKMEKLKQEEISKK